MSHAGLMCLVFICRAESEGTGKADKASSDPFALSSFNLMLQLDVVAQLRRRHRIVEVHTLDVYWIESTDAIFGINTIHVYVSNRWTHFWKYTTFTP